MIPVEYLGWSPVAQSLVGPDPVVEPEVVLQPPLGLQAFIRLDPKRGVSRYRRSISPIRGQVLRRGSLGPVVELHRLTAQQSADLYELILNRHRASSFVITSNRAGFSPASLFDPPQAGHLRAMFNCSCHAAHMFGTAIGIYAGHWGAVNLLYRWWRISLNGGPHEN